MNRKFIGLLAGILVVFQTLSGQSFTSSIQINDLPGGDQVRSSGRLLMAQNPGLTRIVDNSPAIDNNIIILVHGYQSQGYEWITPIIDLVAADHQIYFFRYDWNLCPDSAASLLAASIIGLIVDEPLPNLLLIGHSYGGVVVMAALKYLDRTLIVNANTIAAPLLGYPGLTDRCGVKSMDALYQTESWGAAYQLTQWRTIKDQDGAFQSMPNDPQNLDLPGSIVHRLPAEMDGHRLGHNWSVTWVIRNINPDQ